MIPSARDAALAFAQRGWYVFPLQPGSKYPYPDFKWREKSTNDPEIIRKAAAHPQFKNCNWAVDCGKSGLFIVDIDIKPGKNGLETAKKLPGELNAELIIRTPSGGYHHYYRGIGPNSASGKLGIGLDSRGIGGYVLIPNSVDSKGVPYTIEKDGTPDSVPDWLSEMFLGDNGTLKKENRDDAVCDLDLPANIERAKKYISDSAPKAIMGEGGDQKTYSVACRLRDFGISQDKAFELMLIWNQTKAIPPWTVDELHKKIENAFKYAKDRAGNSSPQALFPDEIPDDHSENRASKQAFSLENLRKNVVTAEQFQALKIPTKEKFLFPWIGDSEIILVTAARGVGKTNFVLGILDSLTTGKDFGPWAVRKTVPTLFFDAELNPADVQERLRVLGGVGRKEQFFVLSDALLTQSGFPRCDLNNAEWRSVMRNLLKDLGVKVWVLDNIASASTSGSENEAEAWRDVNRWLIDLRFDGITTILAHHTNKSGDQRGTISREDNIDVSILLQRPKGYQITDGAAFNVQFTKSRLKNEHLKYVVDTEFRLKTDFEGCGTWECNRPARSTKVQILELKHAGLSNSNIAKSLGCSRPNVSKLLGTCREHGLIDSSDKITPKGLEVINDPFES